MKVLIIGNADSVYIVSIIKNTFLPYGDEVTVLSETNNIHQRFYNEHRIRVTNDGKRYLLLGLMLDLKAISSRYDIVCIHYVSNKCLHLMPFIKLFNRRVIVSYWGSDILLKEKADRLTQRMLKYADRIALINEPMKERFFSLFGGDLLDRVYVADFGIEMLDIIRGIEDKYDFLRKKYEIPENKVVVSIGYNRCTIQQHCIILDAIKMLNDREKDSIHILMRMTYGECEGDYIKSVKEKVNETGCTVTYFESFLSMQEVAEITEITDVFIQAQIADAQSATMLEHLYAKCLVINPEWIDYGNLKNEMFYLTYDNIDSLTDIISKNIYPKNKNPYMQELNNNTKVAAEIGSWAKWIPVWRSLYEQ